MVVVVVVVVVAMVVVAMVVIRMVVVVMVVIVSLQNKIKGFSLVSQTDLSPFSNCRAPVPN